METTRALGDADYRTLAAFRRVLREFLDFSARAAQDAGLSAQQHQLLLAIRGAPAEQEASIGHLSGEMRLAPHSVTELMDRLEAGGFVRRVACARDRRVTLAELTARGSRVLDALSSAHLAELQVHGPRLATSLAALVKRAEDSGADGNVGVQTRGSGPGRRGARR